MLFPIVHIDTFSFPYLLPIDRQADLFIESKLHNFIIIIIIPQYFQIY